MPRLELNARPLGPWGRVWEGGPGKLGLGSRDDGKRASSAIGVECKAARPLREGLGGGGPGGVGQGERDDGKRASSAIEVECQAARPLGEGLGGGGAGSLFTVSGMTESAHPARLKLKVRPLGPWGRVWEGGAREAWAR